MISIRKFWWTSLALAAFVGCSEDQSTAPPATPATPAAPSTPPSDAVKPETTEPAKTDAKDTDTKDMEKPESPPAKLPKIDVPQPDAPKTDADKKSDNTQLSDEELAAIKKLPADEQPLALKQLVCPVSNEHLGAMDTPVKVTADGKTFFLCCKGCKKEVDADAKAVLAKLKN